MKKRAFWGAAAPLAIGLLLTPSAFASSLDYAKSIGQIEMGDTINYVIEATSDGGYVVGGRTLICLKYEYEEEDGGVRGQEEPEGVGVPISECMEYNDMSSDTSISTLFDWTCSDERGGKGGTVRYYDLECFDYIAKFQQNGSKEWLTLIDDASQPVAVGETTSDYRLLTEKGELFTFAKANGSEGLNSEIDVNRIYDAIINNDGTIIAAIRSEMSGIVLFGRNGQYAGGLTNEISDTSEIVYGVDYTPGMSPLVRTKDGIVALKIRRDYNPSTDEMTLSKVSVEKISTDLQVKTPIVEYSAQDLEENGIRTAQVLSADQDGNVLLAAAVQDEAGGDSYNSKLISINKDGEIIAMKNTEDVIPIPNSSITPDNMPRVLDDFTFVIPTSSKLIHLSPSLEVADAYELGSGEIIYDIVALKDGSLAGVGRSTASTANYTVDGGMNGTYLRLAAKKPSGATNPNTLDDANIFALGGDVAVAVIAGAAMMLGKRR